MLKIFYNFLNLNKRSNLLFNLLFYYGKEKKRFNEREQSFKLLDKL